MILAILHHTPAWVWAVLAALVAIGLKQSFPRRLRLGRVTTLPVAFVALSLASLVSALALGLVLAAVAVRTSGAPAAARWLPAERAFEVPGSWLPLALMLGIFALRFAVAVLLAQQPALRGDATFAALAGFGYGGFSGVFLGRALALWRLAREPRVAPA